MSLLAQHQEWLRGVWDQLPSAVLVVEIPSQSVVFYNAQALHAWPAFLRLPAADPGITTCQLVRSDGATCTENDWLLARVIASESVCSEELQFVSHCGRRVMAARCSPIRGDDNRVSAVVIVLQDVTQQREAERELQASQARYESLYQDAPDMFASVSVEGGNVVQCNKTLVQVTGYHRDELIGNPVRDLHSPSCWPELEEAFRRVGHDGHVRDVELQLQCKSGRTLYVSLSMVAIRDEKDNLYYRSTWRDVVARKRAAAVLDEKQAELERSRRELQALAGRLLTVQEDERRRISRELHDDLNQRLAMLTLEIERLYQQLPPSSGEVVDRLGGLRDHVVDLSDAVHDLAYQLHASVLDDLGLRVALESYLGDYRRQESIEVELTEAGLTAPIPTDTASCLYRVAQEALRNVARHARASRVSVSLDTEDGGVRMVIADDGIGFDVSTKDRVGSRLGIVGMQERVRIVDGRFALESQPGVGTRVNVWVPAGSMSP